MRATFDHIEVHVSDIQKYCAFLQKVFEGGTFDVISSSGTSMFTSPDGLNIEVKKKKKPETPQEIGFCNPCIRRLNAKEFVGQLGLEIERELEAPFGMVYFFKDHEGVLWHIKNLPA